MKSIDTIIDELNFDSQDTVEIGEVISAKNQALEEYANFWKEYSDTGDTINISEHLNILKTLNDIEMALEDHNHSTEIISENHAEEYIRDYIDNNHPELTEYADYGYDWPNNYVEFDVDGAIQEKISEADEVNLSGTTFYVIDLAY